MKKHTSSQVFAWSLILLMAMTALTVGVAGNAAAQSADIVVATDGNGDYTSIQRAVDNAAIGDRIRINAGTYAQHVNVNKEVTIYAPNGATITNTSEVSSEFAFRLYADAEVSGLTLTGWRWGILSAGSSSDWTVSDLTIVDSYQAISGYESEGNWKVEDTIIRDARQDGIEIQLSSGDLTIRNTTIINVRDGINAGRASGEVEISSVKIEDASWHSIDAEDTSGEFTITNTQIQSENNPDGINLVDASGNAFIRDTHIQSVANGIDAEKSDVQLQVTNLTVSSTTGDGIDASNATGDGTVTKSKFREVGDKSIDLIDSESDWGIHRSILTGGREGAVDAWDATLTVNASHNYWNAADGPSGQFNGSGGEAGGNIIVSPYYTDSSLTTLSSVIGSSEDSSSNSDEPVDDTSNADTSGDSTSSSDGSGDSTPNSDGSDSTTEGSSAIATRFQQFTDGDSSLPGIIGIGLVVLVGGGVYRRLSENDSGSETTDHTVSGNVRPSSGTTPETDESQLHETIYQDYDERDLIRSTDYLKIVEAVESSKQESVALYSAGGEASQTIDASVFENVAEGFETWSSIDDHQHILTVYALGDTPKPWAAVELANDPFDPADFTDAPNETKRELIVDLCDAVHEGHRYGLAHGGIEESTFVIDSKETPTIKVGDWGITEVAINDEGDQQNDIEAVIDIAFELFTGESPPITDPESVSYPDGLKSVFETAWDDEEGYETVIHFRDAIAEAT